MVAHQPPRGVNYMELYEYLRTHEISIKNCAKLLSVSETSVKKYMIHEREPSLETLHRILKVFDGEVRLVDLMNKTINSKELRKINVNNLPKSVKWKQIKLIQAACRDKNDKIYVDKTYVRSRKNLPEEWFLDDADLDFL